MKKKKKIRNQLYTSVLLVLMALVAVTAATVAWFSIADNTRVRTMSLDIVTDVDMRMDLDAHSSLEQYVRTLSFDQIAERMRQEKGFSMQETPLEPVTTSDQTVFTYENGTEVPDTKGAYLTFTLHFMAAKDMIVHLTSADSQDGKGDGTKIGSDVAALPEAMRISFSTDGKHWIYDPGQGDSADEDGTITTFGLASREEMKLSEHNAMFSLKEGQDKAVKVHIWLEGTDPRCTDALKKARYSIRMRFTGTDMDGKSFTE